MTPDRPDETLAPLLTMTEVDRLSCISAIDVAQGLGNLAELHTLRLLFGEMEAQRGALARTRRNAVIASDNSVAEIGRLRRLSAEKDAKLAHVQTLLAALAPPSTPETA